MVAMGALCLHLDHGVWSMCQTLGWVTVENTKSIRAFSRIVAIIIFAGFVSVPISVLADWLR
jgi:succinate dehydrogenase / fumarate reductase cytochrome b subunit